jgi:hypothetical protein
LAQHAWPAPPHAVHVPPLHVTPGAVHWLLPPPPPGQQVCPAPPQLPQLPLPHVPVICGHAVPDGVHTFATQHPPPWQVLSSQQG